MSNPFVLGVISPDAPFCDREPELETLAQHIRNKGNVVLFSPRRYGKTSLVKRVHAGLAQKAFLAIYVDLFGVPRVEEVARRIAKSVYLALHEEESLLDKATRYLKAISTFRPVLRPAPGGGDVSITIEPAGEGLSGMDLLDKTMEDLGRFIAGSPQTVHLALDEFQEITELAEPGIEGLLRAHIQEHQASYFFIGSRRRLLVNMFSLKTRPFYQSAFFVELGPLPHDALVSYLAERFESGKKRCPAQVAAKLATWVHHYPYYAQKVAYVAFDLTARTATEDIVRQAYESVLQEEAMFFKANLQNLSLKQIQFLKALASDPEASVFSHEFLNRHGLSVSTVQRVLEKMIQLDLVEQNEEKTCRLVDPLFADWLRRKNA